MRLASPPWRRAARRAVLASSLLPLAACSSLQSSDNFLGVVTPYRMEIVQGNVVTKEQVSRLKVGMTREQVVDAIGSPLLQSMFHADRWDYVFTLKRQGVEPQQRSIVVRFEGNAVKSLDVPELPSEEDFVATISNVKPARVPVLELTEEQRRALPPPPKVEPAATTEPQGPARNYPPLEP